MAKTYIPSTVRALAACKAAKKRLAAKLKKVKQEWWEHEGKRLCYAYNNAYRKAFRVRMKVTKKMLQTEDTRGKPISKGKK